MIFETFGPFSIHIDIVNNVPKSRVLFWKEIENSEEGLSTAKGCYMFGIKSSGGPCIFPWYIGKTNSQGFYKECFGPHQRLHYLSALKNYERAVPYLFLVTQLTGENKFYRGANSKTIDDLELYLISLGLRANPKLLNRHSTKFYREVVMPGFLNSSKGHIGAPAKSLRRSFKL